MFTFAIIYWSLVLVLGIFFSIKALNGIYNYILSIGRKWILSRLLFVLPVRLVVNTILSVFTGIIIFFHVLFFVCIITFIYVFMIWKGDSSNFTAIMTNICLFSLLAPIAFTFIKTIWDEYADFKQTKVI